MKVQYGILGESGRFAGLVRCRAAADPFLRRNLQSSLAAAYPAGGVFFTMFALFLSRPSPGSWPAPTCRATSVIPGVRSRAERFPPSPSRRVVYAAMALLLASATRARKQLLADPLVVKTSGAGPAFDHPGVFSATLSSALGQHDGSTACPSGPGPGRGHPPGHVLRPGNGRAPRTTVLTFLDRPGGDPPRRPERHRAGHHHVLHDHLRDLNLASFYESIHAQSPATGRRSG